MLANTRWQARALLGLATVILSAAGCSSAAVHTASAGSTTSPGAAGQRPYLLRFHNVSQIASTVPANGDMNPYGVAVVPQTTGKLARGDILVSNFNSKANVQGTGTTTVHTGRTSVGDLLRALAHKAHLMIARPITSYRHTRASCLCRKPLKPDGLEGLHQSHPELSLAVFRFSRSGPGMCLRSP
jgi:hypothetical protein